MIQKPMDVLTYYQVRKSKKQKSAFIDAVTAYAQRLQYPCRVEKGSLGSRNIIIGDPEGAQYLVTAHYDTCAWMPFPNLITPCNFLLFLLYQLFIAGIVLAFAILPALMISWLAGKNFGLFALLFYILLVTFCVLIITGPANRHTANDNTSGVVTVLEIAASMPENLRDRVCFVLFDLEEPGLIGSMSHRKRHKKATNKQTVLNLDCVGDGDEILLFPTKSVRKDAAKMDLLRSVQERCGKKGLSVREKGFAFYPSDQAAFPQGVGIAAFRRSKLGLYLGRIHTHRDTILEITNVNILRAAIISVIGSGSNYERK